MASKLKDLTCVPFVSYTKADTGDLYQEREQREYETRQRHWAMVWCPDPVHKGKRITAEFMVVTESMPDFCGGMLVYSPRVDIHRESNSWNTHYCAPGSCPSDEDAPTTHWSDFDPRYHALDLVALTGKEDWTSEELEEYGRLCILKQVCAMMNNHGKRGMIGSDYCGGPMTRLWQLANHNWGLLTPWVQTTLHIRNKMLSGSVRCYDGNSAVVNVNARMDEQWYNGNSGNDVHWLMANIYGDRDSDDGDGNCWNCGHNFNIRDEELCPECEEYNAWEPDSYACFHTDTWTVPREVKDVYEHPQYLSRARRYFWRNG